MVDRIRGIRGDRQRETSLGGTGLKARPRNPLGLAVELVPAPLWNRTLAQLARRPEVRALWAKVREVELKRTGNTCEMCGQPARQVHEKWDYDDKRLIQRLVGLEVLCRDCHLVHHQGFAQVHGMADLAIKRFASVNSLKPATAAAIVQNEFDVWATRSTKGPWTQDFGWLVANAGTFDLEADHVQQAVRMLEELDDADEGPELLKVPLVGPAWAGILGSLGVRTIEQLASSKPEALGAAALAKGRLRDPSFPFQVPMAVYYAQAVSRGTPVVTPHPAQLSTLDESRILFVDLEYDPKAAFIFIIGTMTMDGKLQQDFAETPTDFPRLLRSFVDRVRDNDLYCVGYGSRSAEVPTLGRAAEKVGMERSSVKNLPFLDLLGDVIFTQNAGRQWLYLPLKSMYKPMSLKSVAHYFGHDAPKEVAIQDGFAALMRYKEYLRTQDRSIREQLLRYNATDLTLTRSVFEELRNLEAGRADVRKSRPVEPVG